LQALDITINCRGRARVDALWQHRALRLGNAVLDLSERTRHSARVFADFFLICRREKKQRDSDAEAPLSRRLIIMSKHIV
jgi:hypothetical protein